jgi:hypothetical protein
MDHAGSVHQKMLIGQFRSLAVAPQQSDTGRSTGVEIPAVTDLDSPGFILEVVGEKELRLASEVVRSSDIFWTWLGYCHLNRVVEDIPQMSVRKVMIPDMFRTSDILDAFVLCEVEEWCTRVGRVGSRRKKKRSRDVNVWKDMLMLHFSFGHKNSTSDSPLVHFKSVTNLTVD